MENFSLNIEPSNNRSKKSLGKYLKTSLLFNKYSGWLIFVGFVIISTLLAFGISEFGITFGILSILFIVGVPLIFFIISKPKFGIIFYITLAYLLALVSYFVNFPMGTVMDAVLTLLVLGFFIQIKVKNEWHLFSKNISIVIFIWVIYNIIQVFNPAAESRLAWLYTIRTMAIVSISYFVFNFNIRTKNFIKTLFKWWILWSFINACYALKQEYIGFFYFEQSALDANPDMASRYFQGGHMRKFSMLSDPVTFAYNMVTAFFLCIALLNRQLKTFKKITLGFLSILFLYVMLFSGTRAAYLIVPVILVFYAFLTFNRKTLIFFGLASLGIGLLVYTPSSNANIIRFQSAFWPKYDASYLLREENQAKIKPYIYSHPFGGGLGSVGEWGARFSPNSYIGKFQPDSGYVRTTIELGWIGLIIFSVMVLMILITGIKNYYKIRDPELKSYFLACLLLIASWNVGNFAQQSIVQYPSNVLFFLAVALMGAIYRIDQQQNLAVDDKR